MLYKILCFVQDMQIKPAIIKAIMILKIIFYILKISFHIEIQIKMNIFVISDLTSHFLVIFLYNVEQDAKVLQMSVTGRVLKSPLYYYKFLTLKNHALRDH